MSYYEIEMCRDDLIPAIRNYLRSRRHNANRKRVEIIRKLMQPRKKSLFRFNTDPICRTVREAIRYMKSNSEDGYFVSMWDNEDRIARDWAAYLKTLLVILERGKIIGNVKLSQDLSFISTWVPDEKQ